MLTLFNDLRQLGLLRGLQVARGGELEHFQFGSAAALIRAYFLVGGNTSGRNQD